MIGATITTCAAVTSILVFSAGATITSIIDKKILR